MRPSPTLLGLFMALVVLPGCAGVGTWTRARGRDLGDCVRASVGLGVGLYVEAQATSALYPSVGFGDVSLAPKRTLGWDPRPLPPGRVRTAAFPSMLVGWPIYRQEMISMGFEDTSPGWRGALSPMILLGNHHVEGRANSLFGLHRAIPNPLLGEPPPETSPDRWSRRSWFGASGTLGVVTFDFGVNPLEIVDLLGGLVGWDPMGDDGRGKPRKNRTPGPSPFEPLQTGG